MAWTQAQNLYQSQGLCHLLLLLQGGIRVPKDDTSHTAIRVQMLRDHLYLFVFSLSLIETLNSKQAFPDRERVHEGIL